MDAPLSEEMQSEYKACVVGAITQATAALEAEISEVTMHGPGHHLGPKVDVDARNFLSPLWGTIDREPTLRKYDIVLHLLRKSAFRKGAQPYQGADLLVGLRNEIIHYKSEWGKKMDQKRLFSSLENLRFDKTSFVSQHTNFFPQRCLSTSLASWSVTTSAKFIDAFYSRLDIDSPLAGHSLHLRVPAVRLKTRPYVRRRRLKR